MVAPSLSAPALSYADRAKKNLRQPPDPPQKQAPVNVWDRRKEQLAAKSRSPAAPPPPQPAASSPASPESLPKTDPVDPPDDPADDDDPFVVRTDRAPRLHVPLPSAESADDWPQVGKALPPSSSAADAAKPDDPRTESRKGGPPKWVPLPIQAPSDAQPRDPHPSIASRQSTNSSRPSSNYGHGRNSRNHSGRTSATQSATHSRIHSNAGSTHSSPRHPRTKRLPADDPNGAPATRSSRGSSPLPQNAPSFHPTDITAAASNYGPFLSPPPGAAPYYPQPPNLPPVGSPVYQSPSHSQQPLGLPDPSLPMPSVHGYPYVPYYPGYDYVQPPAPYPYWNGHHSHPASGQQSPAYPLSATPSSYAAALPLHLQQQFYQPSQIQPSVPPSSSTSDRSPAGRLSPVSGLDVTTSVPLLDADSKINGEFKRSTSVVFGTIEDTVQPSATTAELELSNGLEKGFKSLAIGVNAADPSIKSRKVNKPAKNDSGEREDHHHHHHAKIANGEIALDPLLAKKAELGETKWKFGNDGLASPAAAPPIDIEAKLATALHAYDHAGKGRAIAKEVEGEERVETSRSQPPREGGGRGRRGYMNQGFSRRSRGVNGFNRGGFNNRGYGRGGGGGGPHPHGGNYQQRQGPPPSYNVPPSLPYQGVPSSLPMEGNYYNGPPGTPLATFIPTGYDPYAPTQQQQPPTPVQPFSAPNSAGGLTSPPMPMPSTPMTYPLDPTRYYLLGQLEYYLSPQNMAQDLFLRRHMDSRGWISISLLASFNRVKRLTQNHQLVHEALMYSSLIQVKDDFARMGGWEQFVLPDAPRSVVEGDENISSSAYTPQFPYPQPHFIHDAGGVIPHGEEQQHQPQWSNNSNINNNNNGGGEGEVEDEVDEDEDEDDVVFVMGGEDAESKGMWSHEKRT